MSVLIENKMNTKVPTSLFQQLTEPLLDTANASGSSSLDEIRRDAADKFSKAGFPTVKNEDWKYTNIHQLVNHGYQLAQQVDTTTIDVQQADIPNLDAHKIILVNGEYVIAEGIEENALDGLEILPIGEAVEDPRFAAHFAKYADETDNALVYLNTALFKSGLFIATKKNYVASKPIHLIHVATGAAPFFAQTRNLIVAAANSELEIVESFITSEGSAQNLNNKVTEIVLEENAKVQHYYLQVAETDTAYINHVEVYQSKHSLYNNYNCNFPGAGFVRNNINVRLDDENVESHLYGINLLADNQLVDNHTIVDHLKPHCESYEWYKNIPQDNSTAVFNGKIFVREDAQKTNAFQQNNNMLIGDKSTVYTKPQLEIFADDVKCSHGCTMGQFDDDALFYLRARGVGEDSARTLLVHAFAFDVTTRFSNEAVKDYVENLVAKGLEKK